MEFNFENIDYRSKLLFGKPIEFEKFEIYPLKLWEIEEFGFDNYNKFTSLISFNKNEIMDALRVTEEISLYDFIFLNLMLDETNEFKNIFLKMFSLCIKKKVYLNPDGYYFTDDGLVINHDNFSTFIQIIKDQNSIQEREEKVVTKKERDYKDMLKKARAKHKEYLKELGKLDNTDLLDLISALACKHPSYNLLNIFDLTVYQLIDQFRRINLIDEYFIGIDSLLAGADKKKINLIHWSKKFID